MSDHILNGEVKSIDISPMRPELMAVGCDDPYVRVYDRRCFRKDPRGKSAKKIAAAFEASASSLSKDSAQYYLPKTLQPSDFDFKSRRSVSCGGVQFSPSGSELLATFNSDLIYLFDVIRPDRTNELKLKDVFADNQPDGEKSDIAKNRENLQNGSLSIGKKYPLVYKSLDEIPFDIEVLKLEANEFFKKGKLYSAIDVYSKAIIQCPLSSVLFANRAQAYLKREWLGDVYAAVRDCLTAIEIDADYIKVMN